MHDTPLPRRRLAAALLPSPCPHPAEPSFSDAQKKEIGEVVREYLLDNPEVLLEVSRSWRPSSSRPKPKQREEALKANAEAIFRSPA